MAYRYRNRVPSAGEVMDPRDWNENMSLLAGEVNGFLDRDNFQTSAVRTTSGNTHVVAGAFNQIFGSSDVVSYSFDIDAAHFSAVNQAGAYIHRDTFTTTVDGTLLPSWSGTWQWAAATTANHMMALRLMVDGREVCLFPRSAATKSRDATMLMGAMPLSPGTHEMVVECKKWAEITSTSGPSARATWKRVRMGPTVELINFLNRESVIRFRAR